MSFSFSQNVRKCEKSLTSRGQCITKKENHMNSSGSRMNSTPKHPLAEVFGFPTTNNSQEAERYRKNRLCPFNNKVPSCTKDKAENPLGVCSVFDAAQPVITCPIRFRQNWLIAEDAATFFFSPNANWTSLTEVRIDDRHGRSAGNIDLVLVQYNEAGRILDFGSLEIQAVYISGNIRRPFDTYIADPIARAKMDWSRERNYPRPDYLSSSRKRLAPQLIYKGGILHNWKKKQAVAVDSAFFHTLPSLEETDPSHADMAWFVYDLAHSEREDRFYLKKTKTVYTQFYTALNRITVAEAGDMNTFVDILQERLGKKFDAGYSPDAPTLLDVFNDEVF
jgi:hypothetical protein